MAAQDEATTLVLLCRASVAVVSLLSLWVTVSWWWNRALGQGMRRPEPTIAALLCNAAWFMYVWTSTGTHEEALWVNGCCGAVQIISLLTFLTLCTHEERAGAVIPLVGATGYLGVAISMGLMRTSVDDVSFKRLCTFAGSVAASAPFLTFAFLAESRTADMLPHWFLSCVSMLHGCLWLKRGIDKVPKDYHMATQNAVGLFCSFLQLALVLVFALRRARPPTRDAQPTQGEEEGNRTPLLGSHVDPPAPPTQGEEGNRTPLLGSQDPPAPPTQGEEGNLTPLLGSQDPPAPRTQTRTKGRKKARTVTDASTSGDVPQPPAPQRRSDRIALATAQRQNQNATPTSGGSQDPAATSSTNRRPPRKFRSKQSTPTPGNQLAPARTASRSAKGKQPVLADIPASSGTGRGRKEKKPRGSKKQAGTADGDPGDERSAKRRKKAGV